VAAPDPDSLTTSQREWLRVRRHLRDHRYELAVAASEHYAATEHAAGTPLLTAPGWQPPQPIPLDSIALDYSLEAPAPAITGHEPAFTSVLPVRPDGSRYGRYSEVIAELAPPSVFTDLPTYRLLAVDLTASTPRMSFGPGMYFDSADVGDAVAHEYTASTLAHQPTQPLRSAVGDPCDPTRRPINIAITTLTLRHDRSSGAASFPIHARDAAAVGHAGGMYQVLPTGVFQPTGPQPWNLANDFVLWRSMIREYAEELLGASEEYGTETAPIDYAAWPFAAALDTAAHAGHVRAYCLGLGVDPLTLATDLLTVVTFDAEVYDQLFSQAVETNTEGTVTAAIPFTAESVERYASDEPTQAAGAAVLRLAWQHRAALLR
jgi:hypothetical protein